MVEFKPLQVLTWGDPSFNQLIKYKNMFSARYNNSYSRPKRYGRSGNSRFRHPRRGGFNNSIFGRDTSIFIKKSQETVGVDYAAQNNFANLPIHQTLKNNITSRGFINPTPIQDQAINPILEGRDLIGLANTGTGKTAAFLIPIINKIFTNRQQKAIIITPTRELAFQINDELKDLTGGMQIYSTVVMGGVNIYRQISDLKRNPQVVIGTPGRLKDLIKRQQINLSNYSTFVLDEVDMMVDIGFIQDIKYFISMLPQVRQSLFFSATISSKVREVLQSFVQDPITVSVKKQDTSTNIDQDIIKTISHDKKVDQLHELLIKEDFKKVLIFGRTKHGIERLNVELARRGFKVGSIHGNKSQGQRQRALLSFKQNQTQVLLATDVASRGLDIDNVTHVINYDIPENYDDYIHRIGRTGRADKKGVALTFV